MNAYSLRSYASHALSRTVFCWASVATQDVICLQEFDFAASTHGFGDLYQTLGDQTSDLVHHHVYGSTTSCGDLLLRADPCAQSDHMSQL